MTIFNFEVKKNLKSNMLWILGILIFMIIMMAFYPVISKEQELMDMILTYYPPELLKAFGLSNVQSFATIKGYLPFIFVFLQLMLAIYASVLGFSTLTLEESERTADFLLTKPVSRTKIFVLKLASAMSGLLLISIMTIVSIVFSIMIFATDETIDYSVMVWLYVSVPLFQLLFFSVGLFISMTLKRVRSVLGLAMGLSFASYGIYSIKEIIDVDWMGVFTPFHYFEAALIIKEGGLNGLFLGLSILIITICMIGSYRLYIKRNIALY